jgi:hypothetical protein
VLSTRLSNGWRVIQSALVLQIHPRLERMVYRLVEEATKMRLAEISVNNIRKRLDEIEKKGTIYQITSAPFSLDIYTCPSLG